MQKPRSKVRPFSWGAWTWTLPHVTWEFKINMFLRVTVLLANYWWAFWWRKCTKTFIIEAFNSNSNFWYIIKSSILQLTENLSLWKIGLLSDNKSIALILNCHLFHNTFCRTEVALCCPIILSTSASYHIFFSHFCIALC